jgi:hypothetical protein
MIRVKAMALGFYDNRRRRKGEVFEIKDESEMGKWMKKMKPEVKVSEFLEEEDEAPLKKRGRPAKKLEEETSVATLDEDVI